MQIIAHNYRGSKWNFTWNLIRYIYRATTHKVMVDIQKIKLNLNPLFDDKNNVKIGPTK